MTLRTLNYGNYGIFLIMGNAGFCPISSSGGTREPQGSLELQRRPQRQVRCFTPQAL